MPEIKNRESILWLWIPVLTITALAVCELTLPGNAIAFIIGENGPLEILQFIILCIALVIALACLSAALKKRNPWLIALYALAAAGCLYTGGEEISWGQQFFKWATPDSWLAVNDQQETNLHNTTSWLDQKPRLILEIGVIVGGLILPLIMRLCDSILPVWLKSIAPPGRMAVIASIFLFVKIFDKISSVSDFAFFKRGSEITEIYIYYFILLYLWIMLRRAKTP